MKKNPPLYAVVRYLIIALCLMPLVVFYDPPSLSLKAEFHGVTKEGKFNIYRSDDAVGYYFRATFNVDPATKRAEMDGVYECLRSFRMRFTDVPEIVIDSVSFYVSGIEVFEMTGKEMSENVAKTSYLDIEAEGESMRITTRLDGAYFILNEQTFMTPFAWIVYLAGIFLRALIPAASVMCILFFLNVRRPLSEIFFFTSPALVIVFGEAACGSISAMDSEYFLLNYFAILGIQTILRSVTFRDFSAALCGAAVGAVYIANHFVNLFRGRPLLPWDLQAAGTAAQVAGAYEFEFSPRVIALISAAVFTVVFPQILKLKALRKIN